jgi:sulfate permease, SulP family
MRSSALLRRARPRWTSGYDPGWLRGGVVAGLTLVVMLVPQGMAYAVLAGMPPITGLYAALVSLLAYAALGTSSHLSFGPFAVVSLLSAAALAPLGAGDSARYVALAGSLAIMVGVLHLVLAIAHADRVVELIALPVVVGFTAAAGVIIGLSQVRDLTGVEVARSERFLEAVGSAAWAIPRANVPTVLVGLGALAVLLLGRRLAPRAPAALAVVALGILAAILLDLPQAGVELVGEIPAGLPVPRLPIVGLDDLRALLPSAIVLALLCFAGNMSMARSIAARTRERLDARRELVASGAANLASGLWNGFPVSASFTRTVVVYNAGARTQLAGVVAAGVLVLTLLVLTPVLQPLPRAVLGAIVVAAVFGLIDVRSARTVFRTDRVDGMVMTVTFLATLGLGVELGLLVGVATNLATHVVRRMQPDVVVLGRVEGTTTYRNVERFPTVTHPGGAIVRLDGDLDFLSVQRATDRILDLTIERPELEWIILVASGITDMDATGLQALRDLKHHLGDAGVDLHLATLHGRQRDTVERAGLWGDLADGTYHPDIRTALAALGVPDDAPIIRPGPDEARPESLR